MSKKEIKFITDLNLNKLQILGDRITIDDIKRTRIHPALFHYVEAEIENELFSDRKKMESDSIFNYRTDRINNYFSLINEEIKLYQNFDLAFIQQIVENGIPYVRQRDDKDSMPDCS